MSLVAASCSDDDDLNGSAAKKGVEAVDLGLSVKWANVNLGASSPWDIGYRFTWGEIEPRTNFYGSANKYYEVDPVTGEGTFLFIGNEISGTKYDAARHILGGKWRLPTKAEAEELVEKCEIYYDEQNGVKGVNVVGPSGKSIFFPFGGEQDSDESDIYGYGEGSYTFTGTLDQDNPERAYTLDLSNTGSWHHYRVGSGPRDDMGIPIRAVRD